VAVTGASGRDYSRALPVCNRGGTAGGTAASPGRFCA